MKFKKWIFLVVYYIALLAFVVFIIHETSYKTGYEIGDSRGYIDGYKEGQQYVMDLLDSNFYVIGKSRRDSVYILEKAYVDSFLNTINYHVETSLRK